MHLELTFPHDYEIEILKELPPSLSADAHYYFPGGDTEGGTDGVLVGVTSNRGRFWVGTFSFGYPSEDVATGVFSCPNDANVCVLARGRGYIVHASAPEIWEPVNAFPIVDVRLIAARRLLIFADFTKIVAYGSDGPAWVTGRLSYDGLRITGVTDSAISGVAWDASQQREVQFSVDAVTGGHVGGAKC